MNSLQPRYELPQNNLWKAQAVAFSPGGDTVALGGMGSAVWLCDAATGRKWATLDVGQDSVLWLAYSPDGRTLAAATQKCWLRMWDAATGRPRAALPGPGLALLPIVFSPDSRTLAAGSQDGTVRLWNVRTERELFVLDQFNHMISSLAFSPDGKALAGTVTVGAPGETEIYLWSAVADPEKPLAAKGREEPSHQN
jgi:Tol biopolymer transport system component